MSGAVKTERAHSQSLLGNFCGVFKLVIRHVAYDFVQCGEMVTHVGKHVLLHWSLQVDQFTRILNLAFTRSGQK